MAEQTTIQNAADEESEPPAHLHVASATGVDLALRIAGLGGRSYAFVIDWHIRVAAAIAWLGIGSLLLFGDLLPRAGGGAALYGVLLPALAIYVLYHPVLEVAMRGQTPGKRLAGLRIVTLDGRVPATGALVVRNLLRLVDSLPALYAVGLTSVAATRQAVRIGDIAAGTLLVYDDAHTRPAEAVPNAAAEQAQLAAELLRRWPRLTPGARRELGQRLLAQAAGEDVPASDESELKARLEAVSGTADDHRASA